MLNIDYYIENAKEDFKELDPLWNIKTKIRQILKSYNDARDDLDKKK